MDKTISILDVAPSKYNNFTCGYIELDQFLKRFAKANHKKGVGKTFILLSDEEVVGYYTVSMGQIEFSSIPEKFRGGLPKYPIPVARIGRLAVHEAFQGRGFGKNLLVDALNRIVAAADTVAAHAVVVDAKDSKAKEFYLRFGFEPYEDNVLSLFLPILSFKRFT